MKRSISFFILVLIVCGLFYFNKTRTQQENQALVQGVVRLKDDCDSKLIKVLDQKKDYNAKVEDLKAAIDKEYKVDLIRIAEKLETDAGIMEAINIIDDPYIQAIFYIAFFIFLF